MKVIEDQVFDCRDYAFRLLNLIRLIGTIGYGFSIEDFDEIREDKIISKKDLEAKVRELLVKQKRNKQGRPVRRSSLIDSL